MGCEQVQDPRASPLVHPELVQQLAIERGVAEADDGAAEPGGVERGAQDLDDLDRPVRRARADQLDARLEELTHLPALRPHLAVGARVVEEAQRRLGRRVPVRDEAGDRHGHVSPHREQLAALRRRSGARPERPRRRRRAPGRRRTRRSASRPRRSRSARRPPRDALQRAQLAHLVGKDVPGAGRDRVSHQAVPRRRCHVSAQARSMLPPGKAVSRRAPRSTATRSIRAPSCRRRSSIAS